MQTHNWRNVMSAFVVEDKTINRIVTYLLEDNRGGEYHRRELAALIGCSNENLAHELGTAMLLLNQQAVNERYGDEDLGTNYTFKREPTTDVQAFKSLQCWGYQCSEGDVPETKLFKMMAKLESTWADAIIRKHVRAYEGAEWG
jgi:hypothetical protein